MKRIIRINNIELFGYHGVSHVEKNKGQIFEIDIEVIPSLQKIDDDSLINTIDYSKLYDLVYTTFSEDKFNLIEYLAYKIIKNINLKFDTNKCKVIIRKPNAPIRGKFESVEVEVFTNE